ncbi:MAG TPA: cytochrome B, partial [Magnetococcales bacterium]|nr:cytochrome B [Magnetococcales bacterium]
MKKVFIYSSFERFWHWTQAVLIVFLMLSGFEVHGTYILWGFEESVQLHRYLACGLVMRW